MSLPEPAQRYRPNLPVSELQTAELFLVTGLRLWVHALDPSQGNPSDWRSGFEGAGLPPEAEHDFDMMFRVVAATARRCLDMRCPKCPRLGEDEGWFLQAIGLLQRNRAREARAILSLWLPDTSLRRAFDHASGLAVHLQAVALCVPDRPDDAAEQRRASASSFVDRGLALIQ